MAASKNQTPSITTIMSIPDGKILDFLTKRFVNDTPEEYVRQNIEKALVRNISIRLIAANQRYQLKLDRQASGLMPWSRGEQTAQAGKCIHPHRNKEGKNQSARKKRWYRTAQSLYGSLFECQIRPLDKRRRTILHCQTRKGRRICI